MQRNEQHEEDQNGDEGPDLFIDNGELYFGIEAENTPTERTGELEVLYLEMIEAVN